jgi:hypothetical protein
LSQNATRSEAAARSPFRLFLLCRIFSSLSFQMAAVAIGWLVYEWRFIARPMLDGGA